MPDITSVFRSNEGHEVPDVTDATNPKLSDKEHSDSDLIFRRTLLGYYAEGMHANFK